MKHLRGVSVLVLGLGESGLAMARWCARSGAQVAVWDSREEPPHAATLIEQVPGAIRWSGALDADAALDGVQLVLKSPGLAPGDGLIAPLLAQAATAGIPVHGELDLFAAALADLKAERAYVPKVIAITGTNGKTTTTSMTAQLIERTGLRVAMAGNIGPTMLDTLSAALDLEPDALAPAGLDAAAPVGGEIAAAPPHDSAEDGTPSAAPAAVVPPEGEALPGEADEAVAAEDAELAAAAPSDQEAVGGGGPPPHLIPPAPPGPVFEHLPEAWVLELSSFQLDGASGFEPDAATVLNVSQDHLDWHGDMAAYAAAKARVFGQTAVMVINRDDPLVAAMVPSPVPGKGRFARPVERQVVRFGLQAPQRPGDFGLIEQNGIAWLVRAAVSEDAQLVKRKRGAAVEEELHVQRLMPADALRVRGRHNAANALAALALATAVGCALAPMLHGLREYAGEPHRVEFVASLGGIDAYDDSKGTNVGATVAALNGLGLDKAPGKLLLILGGDGKGQDFSPLAEPVRRHVRAVATIGRDADVLEAALRHTGVELQRHATLESATRWAFAQARATDAVLLSPACASLDMFRNYAHRAEVFVAAVRALAAETGNDA